MPTKEEVIKNIIADLNEQINDINADSHIEDQQALINPASVTTIGTAIALYDAQTYDVPSMVCGVLRACGVQLADEDVDSIMRNVPCHWST